MTAPSTGGPTIVYRKLERSDLRAAAELHIEVFDDHFLGHMGRRFLELLYGQWVDRPGSYGFVALADRRLVGCVIGSQDLAPVFNDFYRRHFVALSGQFAVRFVRDGFVRRHVAARLPHVLRAIRVRLGMKPTSGAEPEEWPRAQLLSIGVAADLRGRGIAEELAARFCEALAADGVDAVGLSVLTTNPRAIRFYEKSGWIPQATVGGSATFYRYLGDRAGRPSPD
jgi:ribosomal protein S18 acetylase RimI-like enzyme